MLDQTHFTHKVPITKDQITNPFLIVLQHYFKNELKDKTLSLMKSYYGKENITNVEFYTNLDSLMSKLKLMMFAETMYSSRRISLDFIPKQFLKKLPKFDEIVINIVFKRHKDIVYIMNYEVTLVSRRNGDYPTMYGGLIYKWLTILTSESVCDQTIPGKELLFNSGHGVEFNLTNGTCREVGRNINLEIHNYEFKTR